MQLRNASNQRQSGYGRLRYFHDIRTLEDANDYLLLYGRYDRLVEHIINHCVVTNYKRGLFQLAYTLFSGIRNATDPSNSDFQNKSGAKLYQALINPEIGTDVCSYLLKEAFNTWKENGIIKIREDIRPDRAIFQN